LSQRSTEKLSFKGKIFRSTFPEWSTLLRIVPPIPHVRRETQHIHAPGSHDRCSVQVVFTRISTIAYCSAISTDCETADAQQRQVANACGAPPLPQYPAELGNSIVTEVMFCKPRRMKAVRFSRFDLYENLCKTRNGTAKLDDDP
jgi:hypothetical protein